MNWIGILFIVAMVAFLAVIEMAQSANVISLDTEFLILAVLIAAFGVSALILAKKNDYYMLRAAGESRMQMAVGGVLIIIVAALLAAYAVFF